MNAPKHINAIRRNGRWGNRLQLLPCLLLICLGSIGWAQTTTPSPSPAAQPDWTAVRTALNGWQGEVRPSGVLKIELTDGSQKTITVNGMSLNSGLVSHGSLTFSQVAANTAGSTGTTGQPATGTPMPAATGANTLMVGELPVPEEMASKFVRAVAEQGLQLPAVHKHVLGDQPRTAFVHFEEAGDGATLAASLKKAISMAGLHFKEETRVSPSQAAPGLNINSIQSMLTSVAPLSAAGANPSGAQAVTVEASPGVISISIPRAEQFSSCAAAIFNAMQPGGTTTAPAASTTAGVGNNQGTGANASNTCIQMAVGDQLTTAGAGTSGTTSGTGTGTGMGTTGSATGSTTTGSGMAGAANNVNAEAIGAEYEFRVQSAGSGKAIVAAELPLLATEVRDVQRILANAGPQFMVGEVHNHTLAESPRLVFIHVLATGDASHIADVFRSAIANSAAVANGQPSTAGTGASGSGTTGTTGTTGSTGGGASSGGGL